ncbi:hypothetical protein HU200_066211 [Digitaria exilis]|uniref:Uncharacterized protein n=1 Tax=Digitaria exilis TaxID=1010633 RepID=A0A835DX90_9POAL|nr:hypothetical protein HU200_066211 [Digitaria exilis]
MDLVMGAMGNIAPKLLHLLRDEYKLQKGLKEKVQSVSDELVHVNALLRKVAEVPWDQLDEQVKIWLDQLREKSYEMEDILDTFLVRVEGPVPSDKKDGKLKRKLKKKMDSLFSLFSKTKARHDIAGAIEDIMKQLKEVDERRARYKLDDVVAKAAATSRIDPRLVAMNIEVNKLIGIDKSSGELSNMLSPVGNDSTGKIKIVSVVGVGGLGKTTLAQAVYDKLNATFDCKAFVPVGRDRDVKIVLRDILTDLDEKYMDVKYNILDERKLIKELQNFLRSNRYFIVIDDVWSTETWNIIRTAFVENDSGSRVIVTTRKREVASMAEEVYYLQPLSDDDSKMLLYTRLYGGEDKCPLNHPAEASEKILKKCGGVPLAVITMASMLVGKSTEDWSDMCKSFYGGNEGQQIHDTEWILSLSYYDLPLHLRTCLLYLSVYPEDYLIEKGPLIWKWIAEGFVEMKTGTNLFQRGEEYFNQLINSSLIQAVESREGTSIIDRCRVHDMVLDLIRDLSKKVNFVTISNDDGEGTLQRNKQVRRLAHHNRPMKQTHEDDDMGMAKVRSLVVHGCEIDSWLLHPSFKLLRVLALEGCSRDSAEDWQGIRHLGNLLHLRYLGLRATRISELPEEIGKLKFLQILDLEGSGVQQLPSGVCQLTQLLCLRGGFNTRAPDGLLKKVTSLEELCLNIDNLDDESKRQFMKDLGNLSQVRVLSIYGASRGGGMALQSELVQSLDNLHNLQDLRLVDYNFDGEDDTCKWWVEWEDTVVLPRGLQMLDLDAVPFRRLPSCISPAHLQNLCMLWLRVEAIDEAGLRALGGLPELRELVLLARRSSIASTATVASINISGKGFFQKLRIIHLCFGWMIQLVRNKEEEEDSKAGVVSVSFWNGNGAAPFGSRTKQQTGCRRSVEAVPPPVMPNLQYLYFEVPVRALYMDGNRGCDNLGLEFLPSLAKVQVDVNCEGATADDADKAEADLRNAAQLHPNKFIPNIRRIKEHRMITQSIDKGDDEDGTELTSLLEDVRTSFRCQWPFIGH